MKSDRRILFVDHTNAELSEAQWNALELLGTASARSRWETQVACPPGSRLEAALAKLKVVRHAYGIPHPGSAAPASRRGALAKIRAWRELEPAAARLQAIIAGFRPAAVISCTNLDHFAAGAAADRAQVPSIWWVNQAISDDYLTWPLRRLFCRRAQQWATRLVPVSEFARAALLRGGIPAEQVTTIPKGIPAARIHRSSSTLLRDRLKLSPGEPLIGMLGRLAPGKGHDFFLRLARAWISQGRAGRFVMVGRATAEGAQYNDALKKYIRSHSLGSRVHFVAFAADRAETLSQLDVLLQCTTEAEPSERVILEAMAVGLPVIAARAGGIPEIITAGVNGGLAEPGNLESYVGELTALLGDRKKRSAWVTAGRRTVAQQFTSERVFRDFDRLIDEVTAR